MGIQSKWSISRISVLASIFFAAILLASCNNNGTQNGNKGASGTTGTSSSQTATGQTSTGSQSGVDVMAGDTTLGKILVDGKGMSLYIYTKDTPGTSVCYDMCATNWPPLIVSDKARVGSNLIEGNFATTTRKDGSKQVTFEGMPLYYWIKDTKRGDTTGEGVGGVWYVVKVENDDIKK